MIYFLLNTVSKRRTKMARKAAPTPQKYNQRFCGGTIRLTRGRHFRISGGQLEEYREELAAKQAAGAVEVREGSPMGPVVQFATLDIPKPEAESKPVESKPVESKPVELEEESSETPVSEESDDAPEGAAGGEVEGAEDGDAEAEEAQDFSLMTNKELIALILEHSNDWSESELKKLKKVELLELMS